MHESLLAVFLVFRGSGPGAADGYPYQLLNVATGEITSHMLEDRSKLVFLRATRGGRSLVALRGFGTPKQEVVEIGLENARFVVHSYVENAAVLYPMLSPDGKYAAALVVPDRLDMPPTSQHNAVLTVFPVSTGSDAKPSRVAIFERIEGDLPVVPFDWSPDGAEIAYVAQLGGQEVIKCHSTRTGAKRVIGNGVFPRFSADGNTLAHVDGRSVVFRQRESGEVRAVHKTAWPVEWIDWHPTQNAVVISEKGAVYRSRILILDLKSMAATQIKETGVVQDLAVIAVPIRWPAFTR